MSQKPLAQRLDDIEAKMNKLIEMNRLPQYFDKTEIKIAELIEAVEVSRSSIEKIKMPSIDTEALINDINVETTKVFSNFHSTSQDWLDVISYCDRNSFSARKVLKLIQMFNDDEFGMKPRVNDRG